MSNRPYVRHIADDPNAILLDAARLGKPQKA
jgi:hypothetical protein